MPADTEQRVRAVVPEAKVVVTLDPQEVLEHARDTSIAAGYRPFQLFPHTPKLKWFQQFSAGSDWLQSHPQYQNGDYLLTHASGIHPTQATEHVFGLLLTLTRHLARSHKAQQVGEWFRPPYSSVDELHGKTMLIIGVGAIGRRVATVAHAFGMSTIGLRRAAHVPEPAVGQVVGPERLHEVLPTSDVIVVTAPLTPETRHMISTQEFELMKPSAYLINVGRGGTIDEDALNEALDQNRLRGAAIDVFEIEPLPAESPLWKNEKVFITAHNAGASNRYNERALDLFITNLKKYVNGEELLNLVDKKLGY